MQSRQCAARIARGRTDLVLNLLAAPDVAPELLAAALRDCAYFGDVTACRLLVAQAAAPLATLGADLGLGDAAFHGHWTLCEWLLGQGANPRHADPATGETALHGALSHADRARYDRVVAVLLAAGADPNAPTRPGQPTGAFMRDARTRGETPLHRAALFGEASTIERLLAAGADRERRDAHGDTPLAWASWARRPVDVLRPLLYGAHRIHPGHRPLRESLLGDPGAPDDATG